MPETTEAKINVALDENGNVQYTIPKEIADRNEVLIDYSTFQDVDTGDYVYLLQFHLEPKE